MFELLRSELEEAAFLLAKDSEPKKVHSKILNCLVILSNIEGGLAQKSPISKISQSEEIAKVSRKLKKWVNNQKQYNSRILTSYLKLKRNGVKQITEADLKAEIGPNTWFSNSYSQMKNIAEKNNGKVFDQHGEYIEIWKPVEKAVREYENQVFKNA